VTLGEIVDSHCHLDFEDYKDELDGVLERARAASITAMVSIGSGKDLPAPARRPRSRTLSVHLGYRRRASPRREGDEPGRLGSARRASTHPRVVGIGETGLDYYYDHSPRPAQREAFERFCVLSKKRDLPVVCTSATRIPIARRSSRRRPSSGVIHCFTGGPKKRAPISTSDFT